MQSGHPGSYRLLPLRFDTFKLFGHGFICGSFFQEIRTKGRSVIRFLWSRLFLVASLSLIGCDSSSTVQHQNVLLISIDTLRPHELSGYGYERPTSPNIDRIAVEGVLFENAFTTAPWTLPAHASLLTGLYPRHHGAMTEKHALPSDSKTIAETLHAHGFSTAAFVNSYYFSEQYGFNRGFDHFEYEREGAGPESSKVVDKAIRWLLRTKDSPFFLLLHDYHVHSDYLSLPEY